MPSRLYLYYNTRASTGNVDKDSGASIRNTIKSSAATNTGMCPESIWPYKISKYTEKPPQLCYDQGVKCRTIEYISVPRNVSNLKNALAEGYPIVFGFSVYKSFESIGWDGIMPMPDIAKEAYLGGHAVVLVGYDDCKALPSGTGGFLVRNSWGSLWGASGYYWMSYAIVASMDICSDFWFIKEITNPMDVVTDDDSGCKCSCCNVS